MLPGLAPALAGLAAAVVARQLGWIPQLSSDEIILTFGGTIASIATTMLGFMLAALAVLASINHTHLVKMMRASGHYRELLHTLFVGSLLFLLCAICGFLVIFGAAPTALFLQIAIGLHIAALVSLFEVGRKFWFVLSHIQPA